jgi:hypothetical protein
VSFSGSSVLQTGWSAVSTGKHARCPESDVRALMNVGAVRGFRISDFAVCMRANRRE